MKLVISILIPLLTGSVAGLFTTKGVNGWYAAAQKPWFNPPNWLFAPVWTTLYILMGVALYLISKSGTEKKIKQRAFVLFGIQLALNFAWSFIFFNLQQTGWALAELVIMWLAILFTILQFGKISSAAAWLLVPYISWVSFAGVLNYAIWSLN